MKEAENKIATQNAEATNAHPIEGLADTVPMSGVVAGSNTGNVSEKLQSVNKVAKESAVSELEATPATQTETDDYVIDLLEMYIKASEVRFKHLLTGMENSTAAMLKHMKDAIVHLKDHIEIQKAIATKEKTNV